MNFKRIISVALILVLLSGFTVNASNINNIPSDYIDLVSGTTLDFSIINSENNQELGYNWNANTKTLILTNFRYYTNETVIILPEDSIVSLRGNNYIKSTNGNGIEGKGNIKINHYYGATLEIESVGRGIQTNNHVLVEGGGITITSNDKGISANAFTLNIATMQVTSLKDNALDIKDITINSGNLLTSTTGPKIALATTNFVQNGGSVKAISENHAGMWVERNFSITGGSLDIISDVTGSNGRGINSSNANFQISGGLINVKAKTIGINTGGNITVTGGQIRVEAPNSISASSLNLDSENTLLKATGNVQNLNLTNGFVLSKNVNEYSGNFSIEEDIIIPDGIYITAKSNSNLSIQPDKTTIVEAGATVDLKDGTLKVKGILKNNGNIIGNVVTDGGSVTNAGIAKNPNNPKEWILQGNEANAPKDFFVNRDEFLIINSGQILNIPDDAIIKIEGSLINNGTIINNGVLAIKDKSQVGIGIVQINPPLNYNTLQMYTLENFDHLSQAGLNRGHNHDRQNLGIYTKGNGILKIRQTNPNFNQNITFNFFNNNGQNAVTTTIPSNGNWVSVTAKVDSVGFVKTLVNRNNEQPIIEYMYDDNSATLPIYIHNQTNEAEFFQFWNQTQAPYAVYESSEITILVPEKDKNANKFQSINQLLDMYSKMMTQFDKFTGLEDNPQNSVNKNVKAKYFAIPNSSGGGSAYYGTDHMGVTSDSASGFLTVSWGVSHEVGHGYQGSFMGRDLNLGEVWNNIYAHYFQHNGEYQFGDWLNINRNIGKFETERINKGYQNSELSTKLYFWVNLLDTIGPERGMTYFNRAYRELCLQNKQFDVSSLDLMARLFSESAQLNVAPYFEAWGLNVSLDTKNYLQNKGYKNIYPLRYLTNSDQTAQELQSSVNAQRIYSVIEVDKLIQNKDLKSQLDITINIDDFEQIKGKELIFYNGNSEIRREIITDKVMHIKDMPIGVFTLKAPITKSGNYIYKELQYVPIVLNTNNKASIDLIPLNNILGSDFQIRLAGLGDNIYSTITCRQTGSSENNVNLNWWQNVVKVSKTLSTKASFLFQRMFSHNTVNQKNIVEVKTPTKRKNNSSSKNAVTRQNNNSEIKNILTINTTGSWPHSYFPDQEYSKIIVKDNNDNIIYSKSHIGNQSNPSNDTIAFDNGYTIEIMHREAKSRLNVYSNLMYNKKIINPQDITSTFILEDGVLKLKSDTTPPIEILNNLLDEYIMYLSQNNLVENIKTAINQQPCKAIIATTIKEFPIERKNALKNKYADLFGNGPEIITETDTITVNVGDNLNETIKSFGLSLKDIDSDVNVADININYQAIPIDDNGNITQEGEFDIILSVTNSFYFSNEKVVKLIVNKIENNIFAQLDNLINEVDSLDENLYTEVSWTKVQNSLDFAYFIKSLGNPTEDDINEAIYNIQSTVSHLELK